MASVLRNLMPGALGLLFLAATAGLYAADQRFSYEKACMAVPFRVTLYAKDEQTARKAAEAVFARVDELNGMLSDYDPDSEISRLSQASGSGKAVPVSRDLWNVLEQGQALAERSGGAFDVTIGPLVNVWRRARRKQELPSKELIQEMSARVGYWNMRLDRGARTVELMVPDMRLDVGGIAKGYAVDQGLALLRKLGFSKALVAASGDIAVGDAPPGKSSWDIEVFSSEAAEGGPKRIAHLVNCAVSTSGDTFQYVEVDGVRYSHIVDPWTGLGLSHHTMVTIIAANGTTNGTTADSLATCVSVLGPDKGMALVAEIPGAACRATTMAVGQKDQPESKRQVFESKLWSKFVDAKGK